MKAVAIIALAVALEAGFLLHAMLAAPAPRQEAPAVQVSRPGARGPVVAPAARTCACPGSASRC